MTQSFDAASNRTHTSHRYPPSPTKVSPHDDNIMVDVTMEDIDDYSDFYRDDEFEEYTDDVPSRDPKLRSLQRHCPSSTRRHTRWCGWMPLVSVVGWSVALSLVGVMVAQQSVSSRASSAPSIDMNNDHRNEPFVVRINAGASQDYIDAQGHTWWPDTTMPSNATRVTVTGPSNVYRAPDATVWHVDRVGPEGMDLYRDERNFPSRNGGYTIALPPSVDGTEMEMWYRVDLYFCEIFFNATGRRIFDVYLQDELVARHVDVYAWTGGSRNTALVVTRTVPVTNRSASVSIRLESIVDYAKISAIQIQKV